MRVKHKKMGKRREKILSPLFAFCTTFYKPGLLYGTLAMAQFVHYSPEDLEKLLKATNEESTELIAEIDAAALRDLSIHTHSMDGVDKYASSVVDRRSEFKERCEGWLANVATPSSSVVADLENSFTSSTCEGADEDQDSLDSGVSGSGSAADKEPEHYGNLRAACWPSMSGGLGAERDVAQGVASASRDDEEPLEGHDVGELPGYLNVNQAAGMSAYSL